MKKDVKITVTGVSDTGNPEEIPDYTQTVARGTYALINEKGVITYEEKDEETQILTKTLVKFDSEAIEVTRKGSIESKLVFKCGDRYETAYATPYGSFTMATDTSSFKIEEDDKKIDLQVTYDLEINNEFISKNTIVIAVEFI